MSGFDLTKHVVGVSAAVALLAGCSGSGATPGSARADNTSQVAADQSRAGSYKWADVSVPLLAPPEFKAHLRRVRDVKRVDPNCCAHAETLFVSDSAGGSNFAGAVYLYKYPTNTLLGALSPPPEGFSEPEGECVDKAGDVYIANTMASTIDEYSHSGAYIASLSDPGQYPVACAYDRLGGNLAVSNQVTTSGGSGSVSVYNHGILQHTYYPSSIDRVFFLGYRGRSHTLYLDGTLSGAPDAQYASMDPRGHFTPIAIHGGIIKYPGAVQWSSAGKHMDVGDSDTFSAPTFYQLEQADRTDANIVGTTVTQCTNPSGLCVIIQAYIKGSRITAPDASNLTANIFPYPGGGAAQTIIANPLFQSPVGTAVTP